MTKGKVIQIGLLISILGLSIFQLSPTFGLNNLTANSISSIILLVIVVTWVGSYIYRVITGKMTFMEQRRRYREKYEEVIENKIKLKYDALSDDEQKKLLKELDDN